MILRALPSTPSEPEEAPLPLGSISPREWTPPLRKLTPETSYGFAVIHFAAAVLGMPLDPWQQWLVIHLGELLPDGRPRFRKVLVIVARQNGKTFLCTVLALFWLYVERRQLVFGTSNKLEYARLSWAQACKIAMRTQALKARTLKPRVGNGSEVLPTTDDCEYRIGAANEDGGRSQSPDRAIGDEVRQQRTWEAYMALVPAMNARPDAQVIYISNMGDHRSVVLNSLRGDALAGVDPSLGLFEWSAPQGSHPTDPAALAMANPNVGRRNDWPTLLNEARRAARPGADPVMLAGFLTEVLCIGVPSLDPAVPPIAWKESADPAPLDGGPYAACFDCAPDGQHASLAVAARLPDGRVRGEVVAAWRGPTALADGLAALAATLGPVKPRAFGWFPGGPAAAADAVLRDRRKAGLRGWPPRGCAVEEIKGDAYAVCMGFAETVGARGFVHSGQALLDAQVEAAGKAWTGQRWVFRREADAHVDAVYAMAGAVHLLRTMPRRRPASTSVITPS